jgi:hypothetical protein
MQKETFIKYYSHQKGIFWRLSAGPSKIGQYDEKEGTKESGLDALNEAWQYTKQNDKLILEVANSANMQGSVKLVRFNTEDGTYTASKPNQLGFQGSESSFQQGFTQGYSMGLESGRSQAESTQIREELRELRENGGNAGLGKLAENLSSTEAGQSILLALAQKAGLV